MPDSGSEGLQQHPLVEALVPDPAQAPPNAARIIGYLGRSSSSGVWRVYLSVNLDRYVEIPEGEILYTWQLPSNQGTAVWVRRDLQLHYVAVQSAQVQADYLSGPIASAAAQAPAAPSASAAAVPCLFATCAGVTHLTQGCTHGGGGIGPCGGGPTDGCATLEGCL